MQPLCLLCAALCERTVSCERRRAATQRFSIPYFSAAQCVKPFLFIVLLDTTKAFNFLAAIMYQQLFNLLVEIADHSPGHHLPRHCRFILNEFLNGGQISDFEILISTIRSRDIAGTINYQSLAPLKSQYKESWMTILENGDSLSILRVGNNPENLEFHSNLLGNATIEVMNTLENRSGQGSYTKSYQVLGRELITPEEIRTMKRGWCLLIISGLPPFYPANMTLHAIRITTCWKKKPTQFSILQRVTKRSLQNLWPA